jgi:hypothetical protein
LVDWFNEFIELIEFGMFRVSSFAERHSVCQAVLCRRSSVLCPLLSIISLLLMETEDISASEEENFLVTTPCPSGRILEIICPDPKRSAPGW